MKETGAMNGLEVRLKGVLKLKKIDLGKCDKGAGKAREKVKGNERG